MDGISKYVQACPFQPITNKNNLMCYDRTTGSHQFVIKPPR